VTTNWVLVRPTAAVQVKTKPFAWCTLAGQATCARSPRWVRALCWIACSTFLVFRIMGDREVVRELEDPQALTPRLTAMTVAARIERLSRPRRAGERSGARRGWRSLSEGMGLAFQLGLGVSRVSQR